MANLSVWQVTVGVAPLVGKRFETSGTAVESS
jgi:hypothetical protein